MHGATKTAVGRHSLRSGTIVRSHIWLYGAAGLITGMMMCIVCYISGIAPFHNGNLSLARMDADYQYLDFFGYYKDLLAGQASISFDFSKGLGGNMIAVFAYYLTSPFNLLIVFFGKSQLAMFYNVLVIAKMCAAAITMSIFLDFRFSHRLGKPYVLILSFGYALMQYNTIEACNVMWLDGSYMLPLLMLAVYYVVQHKKIALLIATVGLSLVFNWYIAAVNAIFVCLWFTVEIGLHYVDYMKKSTWQNIGCDAIRFCLGGIIGIGCSAFLLIPIFIKLGESRGVANWEYMTNRFYGNPLNGIRGFVYNQHNWKIGQPSLYAGVFVLICLVAFFINRSIELRHKACMAFALGVVCLSFHWQPLYFVFSLLKPAFDYYYRYSNQAVAITIVAAAIFLLHLDEQEAKHVVLRATAAASLLVFLSTYGDESANKSAMTFTMVLVVVGCLLALVAINVNHPAIRNIWVTLMALACMCDVMYSARIDLTITNLPVDNFQSYVSQQERQIDAIHQLDNGVYRISQTSNREVFGDNLTLNMNEGLSYNYNSLSAYTSDPDESQRDFLGNVGYIKQGDKFNTVNESILGADSLLGVKYILSKYPIQGLSKLNLPSVHAKDVYLNPYAMPIAFYGDNVSKDNLGSTNEFEYQNELFSKLVGKDVKLYTPVTVERSINRGDVVFTLSNYNEGSPLYGVVHNISSPSTLILPNGSRQGYSQWLGPGVILIPHTGDSAQVTVTMNDASQSVNEDAEGLFYTLDLAVLKEVTTELSNNPPSIQSFADGDVRLTADGSRSREIITTIPFDDSWEVTVNGKVIQPHQVAGAFIGIPIEDGHNDITMKYHVRGVTPGIIITVLSVIAACLLTVIQHRRLRVSKMK